MLPVRLCSTYDDLLRNRLSFTASVPVSRAKATGAYAFTIEGVRDG
jgi:hypothetical protein